MVTYNKLIGYAITNLQCLYQQLTQLNLHKKKLL
jgi:hypothetical protein